MRAGHKRIPAREAKARRFGMCSEHPEKENEFYDAEANRAFCTICAIDVARSTNSRQAILPIEQAYNEAKFNAQNPDAMLEQRKTMIKHQMDQVSN